MNRLRLIVCVGVCACAACAIVIGCQSAVPEGGFLHDTAKLRTTDLSEEVYVQFDDAAALANYDAFTVAPLTFRFTPRRPRPVALRELDAAEAAFHAALEAALTQDGRFAPAAGPGTGVLQLRAGITDRFQRDEEEPGPGFATVELEALDSLSKKRVFAIMDPTLGLRDSGGEHTSPVDAFNRFARRLRARIDDAED